MVLKGRKIVHRSFHRKQKPPNANNKIEASRHARKFSAKLFREK